MTEDQHVSLLAAILASSRDDIGDETAVTSARLLIAETVKQREVAERRATPLCSCGHAMWNGSNHCSYPGCPCREFNPI